MQCTGVELPACPTACSLMRALCMQVWLRRNQYSRWTDAGNNAASSMITKPLQPEHRQAALKNCCNLSRMCSQQAYVALWWSSRWQMT